mgnify:CR=1 FL=1
MTSRLLIDFGHILQILDLHAGMSLVELGCGSGWMTRFAARHGLDAHGYDISPEMIAIARELAEQEGTKATFEVADMEKPRPRTPLRRGPALRRAPPQPPRRPRARAPPAKHSAPAAGSYSSSRTGSTASRAATRATSTASPRWATRRAASSACSREAGFARDHPASTTTASASSPTRPREIAAHVAEPLALPGARTLLDADLAARYSAVASEAA